MYVKPILRVDPGMGWGRLVNFEDLKKEKMDIEPEIRAAGWRNFFEIQEEVYTQEVFEFWKNTKPVGDTIVSFVANHSVIVTKELLEKVTGCPINGAKLSNMTKWMTKLKMNEVEVSRQLYGRNDPSERRASWLVPKARILFAILCDCILPRVGSRHQVTTLDEQCIFHLLNHHPIDLPFLLYQYMVKLIKDTSHCPFGMILTRIFRESGIRLDWGIRQKVKVRSYIDSTAIARMGLRSSDREDRESSKKARIEGERSQQKSPVKISRSQSQDSKGSNVRSFESGILKRKGESLLSDFPKQAKRSPRVRTIRQHEEKKSRESVLERNPVVRASKATRSLESILKADSSRQSEGGGKQRKEETEKKKWQPKSSPRMKLVARKSGSPEKVETSKKTKLVEKVADVAVLEAVSVDTENITTISDISVFEEIIPSVFESTLVKKKIATTVIVREEKKTVVDVMTNVPSKNLKFRREAWEHRLVVRVEKKTRSVIIRDNPKRYVKAFFKPVVYDNSFMYLMDSCYKKFYDQLQRVAREVYPPEPSAEQNTLYPILPSTVIKVVPDLQPPNYVEINHEKLKLKVVPEPVLDDMSSDQIAEAVRIIDEACAEQRNVSSICIYQDPGISKTKATTTDPQGGVLRKGRYHSLLVGKLECSYSLLKNILRNRSLWEINSVQEVMPWVGRSCLRLPEPDDLDIPNQVLNIQPPRFQVIESSDPNDEAYSTTIAVAEHQSVTDSEDKAIIVVEEQSTVAEQALVVVTAPPPTTESSIQAAHPSLEQLVLQLAKDMKKMTKKMKKMEKMMKKK